MIKEAIKQNRKLFIRFFVSFAVTCLLGALLCVTANALSPDPETETQVLAANPDAEPVDESRCLGSKVQRHGSGIHGR